MYDPNAENSGASGIYEVVPACAEISGDELSRDVSTSELYEPCGPCAPPPNAPPRGSPSHAVDTLECPSGMVRRGSSKENLSEKPHNKEDKNEKHEHHEEKHKGGGLFKLFGHSRKSKKSEDAPMKPSDVCEPLPPHLTAVDIPVDAPTVNGGGGASGVSSVVGVSDEIAPPPLPSVDKLMHISATHRKQHSQTDINPLGKDQFFNGQCLLRKLKFLSLFLIFLVISIRRSPMILHQAIIQILSIFGSSSSS